jgi:hypothetical protein
MLGRREGQAACGITRRWSGPRRRYTSVAVERRACAAAAAQRHYVMPQDFESPPPYIPRQRRWSWAVVSFVVSSIGLVAVVRLRWTALVDPPRGETNGLLFGLWAIALLAFCGAGVLAALLGLMEGPRRWIALVALAVSLVPIVILWGLR